MQPKKPALQPIAISLTVVAALVRLIPHPPNFAPIGATALFGGARLRGWQAYLVPLLAMLATDPIRSWMEGGYPAYSWSSLGIYASFLISVVLGRVFLQNTNSAAKIGLVALAASTQFFLLTNFMTWAASTMYPHTWTGLTECYVAAIPFFGYTVAGDLCYSAALFGLYAWLKRYSNEDARVQALAA